VHDLGAWFVYFKRSKFHAPNLSPFQDTTSPTNRKPDRLNCHSTDIAVATSKSFCVQPFEPKHQAHGAV
jgi:hypothetical protein